MLLVDDDPSLLEGLRVALRHAPFSLLVATSGTDALSVLAQYRVDLVVADQRMPGMSGLELLAIVAEKYPKAGRIVLTGEVTLDVTAGAIGGGAHAFLTKPCSTADFEAMVEETIASLETNASCCDVEAVSGVHR